MKPFFFGETGRQLFGAYHRAADDRPQRDVAVVLSYPGIADYNTSHWLFRKLAGLLSHAGFPTLRFDYYGTGDSMGETRNGSLEQWVSDVAMAANEVRDLSGAREVSLVGLGLGAALAALAAVDKVRARELVLWDPVLAGRPYLARLEARDRDERLSRLYPSQRPSDELLGYHFPISLRHDLERLDVCRLTLHSLDRLLVIASQDQAEWHTAVADFRSAGIDAHLRLALEEASAPRQAAGAAAVLASAPLTAIVDVLSQGAS